MEWISVKDRLPNEDTAVYLYACGYDIAFLRNGQWLRTWDMSVVRPHSVSHWMPLPSKPEVID
jgi:hypothetical protein